jgi:hypothetical protein
MTEKKTESTLDFEASAAKLAEWLATFRDSEYTPTKSVKELRALARQLIDTADMLDSGQWMYLEHVFDSDPPPAIGLDGWPIATEETNTGRYLHTVYNLRELARTALEEASKYPNSRAKPELRRAANLFLHIWREAGKDRPAIYDGSEAVSAFKNVLGVAGYPLSDERARGILSAALKDFDPHYYPEGDETMRFFVWRQ